MQTLNDLRLAVLIDAIIYPMGTSRNAGRDSQIRNSNVKRFMVTGPDQYFRMEIRTS